MPLRSVLVCLVPFVALAQVQVTTYHNDNARTGQDLNELLLTPQNVGPGSFGKRFTHNVDGQILGQPLYLPSVPVDGKGLHDLVFVATAHDSVYAFDADSAEGADAGPLWQVSFLSSSANVIPVPASDVSCPVIVPELGVVGTPVIDPSSGTLYVVAETKEQGSNYVFRLHALDVASGAEKQGSPVVIGAPGFSPFEHKQRASLLLSNGVVYVPFGSNCDLGDYHGWVFGYDAASLAGVGVFNVSPQAGGSSFWNAGAGPAADDSGNIFIVSANGTYDIRSGGQDYGDSVLRLKAAPELTVSDYFTPFNQSQLNLADIDLGSSTVVLLPEAVGSSAHPRLLVTAGKEGRLYLLDRDHLGGGQVDSDRGAVASLPILGHSLFGVPAYFNGNIYVGAEYSMLRSYAISNGDLNQTPAASTSFTAGALGEVPSISANGSQNGIVWMSPFDAGGALHAYSATTLGKALYSSNDNVADNLGGWVEFAVPTVADGKVFVGTQGALVTYGLISAPTPGMPTSTNAASYDPQAISPGGLISLFGSNLALTTAWANSVPLPISLTDVSVTINGLAAPLLYVSPTQINAQVPYGVAPGPAGVVVRVSGVSSPAGSINVQAAAPGIFGIVNNADPTAALDSALPAPGAMLSVYLTGVGKVNSNIGSGAAPAAGTLVTAALNVTATIGGVPAVVQFAGLAPGFPGVDQVNLEVPQIPPGTYPVVITVDGVSSNAVSLTVGGN